MILGSRLALVLFSAIAITPSYASPSRPPYLDFSNAPPPRAGQFFELDLEGTPLAVVTVLLSPDEQELIRGLDRARVRVIDIDSSNRRQISQRVRQAIVALNAAGWKRFITPSTVKSQSASLFAHSASRGDFDAVAVLIWDRGDQAVVGFATGEISAAAIKAIAARIKIDELRERFAR